MLVKIYRFIVTMIATPLAVISVIVGGVMMMMSAGNPNLMGTGKKIIPYYRDTKAFLRNCAGSRTPRPAKRKRKAISSGVRSWTSAPGP